MSLPQVLRVPVSELDPDPRQPRQVITEESAEMLAGALEGGQVQPILVYRSGKRFIIIDGHRRWRALLRAGAEFADVVVVEQPTSAEDVLEKQLLSNVREDLPPLDYSRAVQNLKSMRGWTIDETARRLGCSTASISKAIRRLALPKHILDRLERREITADAAYQIGLVDDTAEQERLAALAADGLLTRDAIAGGRKAKARAIKPASSAPRVVAKLAGGRSVVMSGVAATLDEVIVVLEELLAKARKARPKGLELSTFLALLRDEARKRPAAGEGAA